MRTITKTLAALGIAGAAALTLAPMAAAQDQPIAEGRYMLNFTNARGQPDGGTPTQVTYCGPDCFALGSVSPALSTPWCAAPPCAAT